MRRSIAFLLLAVALPLAISRSLVQAEVFSLSGEIVRLDSPGTGSDRFGLAAAGGEVVASLHSSHGEALLTEGPARLIVEQASTPGAGSGKMGQVFLVKDQASNAGERDGSGPFPMTGPAAFSGSRADRSQLYWAGNGHPQHLPSAHEFITFRGKPEQSNTQFSENSQGESSLAATVPASFGTQAPVAAKPVEVRLFQSSATVVALAPKLAVGLEGSNVRLTWMAPSGALCHILSSPDATGPYQIFSSQTATVEGPMSLLVPVTEISAFLQLQVNLP